MLEHVRLAKKGFDIGATGDDCIGAGCIRLSVPVSGDCYAAEQHRVALWKEMSEVGRRTGVFAKECLDAGIADDDELTADRVQRVVIRQFASA